MPTGYTAAIKDGITFEQFTLNCARAFGALICMRDDPADAPIPEQFEPSDYSAERLKEVMAAISALEAMTIVEKHAQAKKDYDDEWARIDKAIADKIDLLAKYTAMLYHVNAWIPPTPEHEELKEFMRKQIIQSTEFDCDIEYYRKSRPDLHSGQVWADKRMESLQDSVKYHTKACTEEVKRTDERNAWVKVLRMSLKESQNA